MGATETVTLRLTAVDLMSGNVTKAIGSLDKLAKQGGFVGSMLQGVGQSFGQMLNPVGLVTRGIGMFTDALGDAVNAAREDQVSQVRLRAALEANIEAWDGNTDAIEDVIAARTKLGFQDDEQRSVLASLVTVTEDLNDALAIERTAMDLARLKGIDLASAAKVLGNAYAGATGQLAKMGIRLGKGVSGMEALEAVQGRVAGQAEEYARTAAGATDRMNIAIGELSESIGYLLSGPAADLAGFIADLAGMFLPRSDSALRESTKWLKVYTDQVFHAATEQRGFNEAIADGPKPIDIFTDALDSWIIKQGDLLAQLDATGELARMMSGVNRTLAFTTGLTADEIFQLAQVTQIAGGDLDELTINMQKLIGAGIDLQGMAMRYVKDFDVMSMSTEQFERLFLSLGNQVQSGKMKWQDWGRTMMTLVPWIEEHFAELPEWLQKSLLKANLGLDVSLADTRVWAKTMGDVLGPGNPDGPARATRHTAASIRRTIDNIPGTMREAMDPYKAAWREFAEWAKDPFRPKVFANKIEGYVELALKKSDEAAKRHEKKIARRWQRVAQLMSTPIAVAAAAMGQDVEQILQTIADAKGAIAAIPGIPGVPSLLPALPQRKKPKGKKAMGGPVSAGGTYLVGEEGPELLTLGTSSGHVTPNAGGVHVHLHGLLVAPTEAQTASIARTIAPAIRREMARAGG